MRRIGLLGLLLLTVACGRFVRQTAPAYPYETATDSLIGAGLKMADLVVLGTPDSMVPEGGAMSSLGFGAQTFWWNVRITVDSIAKGKPSHARFMDYGDLPTWVTPPRPFKLSKRQITVQQSNGWVTAPLVVGTRAIYFLKKCYNCVDLPGRTEYRMRASPWLAVLALTPDHWARVKRLATR